MHGSDIATNQDWEFHLLYFQELRHGWWFYLSTISGISAFLLIPLLQSLDEDFALLPGHLQCSDETIPFGQALFPLSLGGNKQSLVTQGRECWELRPG